MTYNVHSNYSKSDLPSTVNNSHRGVQEDESDTTSRVHRHLIMALLLPNHPFSREVRKSLIIVAPMFPSIKVVVGNAYNFDDLVNKYSISSFPKVLFFKSGIYTGKLLFLSKVR